MLQPNRMLFRAPIHFACVLALFIAGSAHAAWTAFPDMQTGSPGNPANPGVGVEVDDSSGTSLMESALRAFDRYLQSVDGSNLDEARQQALDPGYSDGRMRLVEKLIAFIRGRRASKIENEGVVVRLRGDWALVVYQYDTVVNGQTTRVITTAWMVQWDGTWKQFVVAPRDAEFWKNRRGDFEELQAWFDEHAREVAGRNEGAMILPVPVDPLDDPLHDADWIAR